MMPRLGAAEVPIGAAATAAARSQFEDLGAAALSQCAAEAIGAMRVGATDIGAATAIGAMVSVRQRSARPLLARPLLALVRTAVTATTPTATGFALGIRTERRDAVGQWCSKPMMKSSA
jgi:hypothetical protein